MAGDARNGNVHDDGFGALALFTLAALLIATLMCGHVLSRKGVAWISEAGIALLLGLAVGGLVLSPLLDTHGTFGAYVGFSKDFFMLAILPPIIFEAGWSMDVDRFFANSGAIGCLAFLGTVVSTFVIALLVWAAGALGLCAALSFLEASLFGSIVSATDPVTVLAVFQRLGADTDLFALVLGESLLNDAVSIVLFRSLSTFLHAPVTGAAVAHSMLVFVGIFLGSMAVGAATAFGAAALVKTRRFRSEHMPLESCLVTLLAFASYWLADGLRLSGIVSILFHGITGAHYVRPNLSQRSQDRVGSFFKLLACLAETSVFLFIGSSLFLDQQELSGARLLPFTMVSFVALAVSRAANVWPCAALVNYLRVPAQRIPQTHQLMLWWSGLRGAMAFAIALEAADIVPDRRGDIMLSATYLIVLATVLANGGGCAALIDRLGLGQQHRQDRQLALTQADSTGASPTAPLKQQELELHAHQQAPTSPGTATSAGAHSGEALVPLDNTWSDTTGPLPALGPLPVHSSAAREKVRSPGNINSRSIERLREANQEGLLSKLEQLDKRVLGPLFLASGRNAAPEHGGHVAGDMDHPTDVAGAQLGSGKGQGGGPPPAGRL